MATEPTTRVAIVTGAAAGIGLAIAHRLAEDGLAVALNDIPSKSALLADATQGVERKGGKVLCVPGDVAVEEEVRSMIEQVTKVLGRVDVMVANAGIAMTQTVMDADIEAWERIWAVNMRGVVLCYKHAAIQMVKQGTGGRIIGASSICGKKGYANLGAYCMSKFAVRGLTQSTALELAEHGITVNAYAPGMIDTAMVRNPADAHLGGTGEALKKMMRLPDAKVSSPEVIASIVSYFASAESHFITGQTINVDGGVSFD